MLKKKTKFLLNIKKTQLAVKQSLLRIYFSPKNSYNRKAKTLVAQGLRTAKLKTTKLRTDKLGIPKLRTFYPNFEGSIVLVENTKLNFNIFYVFYHLKNKNILMVLILENLI